jgi:hypothetical protein
MLLCDLTKLEDNIRDYYTSETKVISKNTEQHHILFEFLKYAKWHSIILIYTSYKL